MTQGRTSLEGVQISLEKVWFIPTDSKEVGWLSQAGTGLEESAKQPSGGQLEEQVITSVVMCYAGVVWRQKALKVSGSHGGLEEGGLQKE